MLQNLAETPASNKDVWVVIEFSYDEKVKSYRMKQSKFQNYDNAFRQLTKHNNRGALITALVKERRR